MPKAVNWTDTADAKVWQMIAAHLRTADTCTRGLGTIGSAMGDDTGAALDALRVSIRVHTAECSAAIAAARELATFLVNPATRQRARKAINANARALRDARGV